MYTVQSITRRLTLQNLKLCLLKILLFFLCKFRFNISGGCMNPTLCFGAATISNEWRNHWIYWIGPLLGAFIAAVLFRYLE